MRIRGLRSRASQSGVQIEMIVGRKREVVIASRTRRGLAPRHFRGGPR